MRSASPFSLPLRRPTCYKADMSAQLTLDSLVPARWPRRSPKAYSGGLVTAKQVMATIQRGGPRLLRPGNRREDGAVESGGSEVAGVTVLAVKPDQVSSVLADIARSSPKSSFSFPLPPGAASQTGRRAGQGQDSSGDAQHGAVGVVGHRFALGESARAEDGGWPISSFRRRRRVQVRSAGWTRHGLKRQRAGLLYLFIEGLMMAAWRQGSP